MNMEERMIRSGYLHDDLRSLFFDAFFNYSRLRHRQRLTRAIPQSGKRNRTTCYNPTRPAKCLPARYARAGKMINQISNVNVSDESSSVYRMSTKSSPLAQD